MSRIDCPECGKGLRVPESKRGAVVRCPGCKEKFRIPDARVSQPNRQRSADGSRRPRSSGEPGRRSVRSESTDTFDIRAFLKRLLPIHAVVLGLAILLIIGGFFSQYSSLAAAGVLVIAAVGCIITGRIWMAIDIGRKNVGLGIAALLVPAVGVVISFRDRGRSMRGAATLISCIVPALVLGLVVLLFAPGGSGRPAFGPGAPSKAMNPEAWADIIGKAEQDLTSDSPVVTVDLKITARGPNTVETLAAEGDGLLRRFPSYVAGSLQVDVGSRTGTLQYRGKEQHKNAYAFFVGLSTNTFVRAE